MDEKCANKIFDILENFDFDKVEDVMKYLGWKWYTTVNSDSKVPSKDELRDKAKELLTIAVKEHATVSSGGFSAEYNEDDELSLQFVLTEYFSF